LILHSLPIQHSSGIPNSFVPGRNGLFLMMAAPFAAALGASSLFIGVMEREGAHSGYPDCNRPYIDSVQTVIRLDLQNPSFMIHTPLIHMSKAETLEVADALGALEFLLQHTISCYNGVPLQGCQSCPACRLRNEGIAEFYQKTTL
jgi:7-cyano-7-deazaguanine synthase